MGELTPGETLLLARGTSATVTNTRTEHLTTPVKIYNLEVADWHTYHAGTPDTGWVYVHNQCAGVARYGSNGGHHIHAQSAFKGHPKYNGREALSLSQTHMAEMGWNHNAMTTAQGRLYRALERSGREHTMAVTNRIAELALRKGHVPKETARDLVAMSLRNLLNQGVRKPSYIPRFGR